MKIRIAYPTLLLTAATLALTAIGCATAPNQDVIRAQRAYQAAERNPDVDAKNSIDLYEASRNLGSAEQAAESRRRQAEASHYAHLAETRVQIAELSADTRKRRAHIQQLIHEREELRLFSRTEEADRATARASTAEEQAAAAGAAAAAASQRAAEAERQLEELKAQQTERGLLLTLDGVLFEFGKAELKPAGMQRLSRIAGFLIANTDRSVLIEGFTDDVGSDDFNLGLSQRRAESVSSYLQTAGVSRARLHPTGYGKAYPVAPNDSDANRALNRRVELIILEVGVSVEGSRRR